MQFYVYSYSEEVEYGPLDPEQVIELLYEQKIQWDDAIREEDSEKWQKMEDVFDLELIDGQ